MAARRNRIPFKAVLVNFSRRSQITLGIIVIAGLVWWFYPREPLPLGYVGTGPNPDNIPGTRPTIECPINTDFMTGVKLKLDGMPVESTEVKLLRNKKVKVQGKLELGNVPALADLLVVELSVASKSRNAQGMLIEGETMLYAGAPTIAKGGTPLMFDTEWLVPDHAGEFNLLLVFHMVQMGERETPRRFAIVCPVKIE